MPRNGRGPQPVASTTPPGLQPRAVVARSDRATAAQTQRALVALLVLLVYNVAVHAALPHRAHTFNVNLTQVSTIVIVGGRHDAGASPPAASTSRSAR